MVIAFDFDGTLVKDDFPRIGEPLQDGIELMRRLIEEGHEVILFTVRSGEYLKDAVRFLSSEGIFYYSINKMNNPVSDSPKVYYDVLFDDRAFGMPLVKKPGEKPYVDWGKVLTIINIGTFY